MMSIKKPPVKRAFCRVFAHLVHEIIQAVYALFLAVQPLEQQLAVGREQAQLRLALPRRFQREELPYRFAAATRVAQVVQQRLFVDRLSCPFPRLSPALAAAPLACP